MKYTKEKITLLDNVAVFFREESKPKDELHPFNVRVDRSGIQFLGNSQVVMTWDDLQDFAEMVSNAWKEHERLVPKLSTTLSGH